MERVATDICFDRLFSLRLVVARHGEMDLAGWWNTQGVLGRRGAGVLRRGFVTTHRFAQARIVFEVARTRCRTLFEPPNCMTLWSLPAEIEEQFEGHWQVWLDEAEKWEPVFALVEEQSSVDLLASLQAHDLVTRDHLDAVGKLRRSAEFRAVPIAGVHAPTDDVITLLAAGFSRGETGKPAIPYARLEG